MALKSKVAILIVGFRNADDIRGCLRALSKALPAPAFEIFIAENGGSDATDAIINLLAGDESLCRKAEERGPETDSPVIVQRAVFQLVQGGEPGALIHIAESSENLGYAGGINAWLRPLLKVGGWEAAWILNPDTEPAPSALAELAAYSEQRGKGMVGSRLMSSQDSPILHSRGLAWRKLIAKTLSVDRNAPVNPAPDPDDVEARLTSPSGASLLVTRGLIEKIGLMDERYFLYYEDLDWGERAKKAGALGYAHRSVVFHKGGTTIGSAGNRAETSPLSAYLGIRNCILFVRNRHVVWLPWTILMQGVHTLAYGAFGGYRNMLFGFRGLFAGILGEEGRPDHILGPNKQKLTV